MYEYIPKRKPRKRRTVGNIDLLFIYVLYNGVYFSRTKLKILMS